MSDQQNLTPADEGVKESLSRPPHVLKRIWAQREGKIGVIITVTVVALALLGPLLAAPITGVTPYEFVGKPFSNHGLFGTDNLGRSVGSRFLAGGLLLLVYSVLATALGMVVGAVFGMLAAYAGGAVDSLIMRINDVFLAVPQLVFALLAVTIAGPKGWVLVLVIGLTHAPRIARVAGRLQRS